MAGEEQLRRLKKKGVEAWNAWRERDDFKTPIRLHRGYRCSSGCAEAHLFEPHLEPNR
jgi:hypothetical protein